MGSSVKQHCAGPIVSIRQSCAGYGALSALFMAPLFAIFEVIFYK